MIFWLFCSPQRLARLRPFLAFYQRSSLQRLVHLSGLRRLLPASLAAMESVMPRIKAREDIAAFTPAIGVRRGSVGVLTGCVQSAFFSEVNSATIRVLAAEGFDVVVPQDQGCCGALSSHSGRLEQARQFARETIDLFANHDVEVLIVNSAGCGSAIKEYAHILAGDPAYRDRAENLAHATRDVSEFLASIEPRAERQPFEVALAYHDACHLSHAQSIRDQPRALLGDVAGVEVREIANADVCCGSAGIYNLVQPQAGAQIGDMKADAVIATDASLLLAGNPGCLMHLKAALLRQGRTIAVAHTIEVLDASIRGQSVDQFLAQHS